MSEIDIERLKVDERLWPETATHYFQAGNGYTSGFYRNLNTVQPEFCGHDGWSSNCDNPLTTLRAYITRPTKQEWEGGFPPVGSYSRISRKNDVRPSDLVVKIVCYTGQLVVVENDVGTEYALSKDQVSFGPEISKAERQREELISIIEETGRMREEDTADAILSHYNLEPKP